MASKVKDIETLKLSEALKFNIITSDTHYRKWMGFVYLHIDRNRLVAINLYKQSADEGDATSVITLARIYAGEYICLYDSKKEYSKAGFYFQKAGLQDKAEFYFALGIAENDNFTTGQIFAKNGMLQEANRCYHLAAKKGDKRVESLLSANLNDEQTLLAITYYKSCNNFDKLSEIYSKKSETDLSCTELLIEYTEKGVSAGCRKSMKRAIEVYLQLEDYEKAFSCYDTYCNSLESRELSEKSLELLTNGLLSLARNKDYVSFQKRLHITHIHASILLRRVCSELNIEDMISLRINIRSAATLNDAFELGATTYCQLYFKQQNTKEQALARVPNENIELPYYARLCAFLMSEGGTDIKSYKYHVVSAFFDYKAKSESKFGAMSKLIMNNSNSETNNSLTAEEFITKVIEVLEELLKNNQNQNKTSLINTFFHKEPVIDMNILTLEALKDAIEAGQEKYKGLRGIRNDLTEAFEGMTEENYRAKLYVFLTGPGGNNLKSFKYKVVLSLFNLDEKSIKTDDQAFTVISSITKKLGQIEGLILQAEKLRIDTEEPTSTSSSVSTKLFYCTQGDDDL